MVYNVKRGYCQGCGAEIYWVVTAAGKRMPVNPQSTPYWAEDNAKGKIVTMDGRVVSCRLSGPRDSVTGFGFISHFSIRPKWIIDRMEDEDE